MAEFVPKFVRVGSVGDFDEGKLYDFRVEGRSILVVRHKERFFALSNVCTHAGFTLTPGKLHRGLIDCPVHGARFRPTDGEAERGPAGDPLDVYSVRVDGDDVLVGVE